MDPKTLTFIISVAGIMIVFLLSMIGFFLKKIYDRFEKLTITVQELTTSITGFERESLFTIREIERLNKRLDNMEGLCKHRGEEIAVLKQKTG